MSVGLTGDEFRPADWPLFLELHAFTSEWKRHGLDEKTLAALHESVRRDPNANPVMSGTNGLRKIRFVEFEASRGKRGAYRALYVHFPIHGVVALVAMFGKNEKTNLTQAGRNAAAALIRQLQADLERMAEDE